MTLAATSLVVATAAAEDIVGSDGDVFSCKSSSNLINDDEASGTEVLNSGSDFCGGGGVADAWGKCHSSRCVGGPIVLGVKDTILR